MLAGPLYWRLAVVQTPEGDQYVERLTRVVVAGIKAACSGCYRWPLIDDRVSTSAGTAMTVDIPQNRGGMHYEE